MRAVLDANVLVSAALSPAGPPGGLIERWLAGDFDLVVSPALLDELARVLGYPKVLRRVDADDAAEYVDLLQNDGMHVPDPERSSRRAPDPGDDYLIALAESVGALLVTGDRALLTLAEALPIRTPRSFLELLEKVVDA